MTATAATTLAVPELPAAADPDAFFAFVMRLADLVTSIGTIALEDRDRLDQLLEDVAALGVADRHHEEVADLRHQSLRQELEELSQRVSTVHANALRALNARYGPRESA